MIDLSQLRRDAQARFEALGYPTTHDEEWKYTSVAPIARTKFEPARSQKLTAAPGSGLSGVELVFVNGRLAPELSSTNGVKTASLAHALESRASGVEEHFAQHAQYRSQPFVALNTAAFTDGAYIHIGRGEAAEKPVHLLFVSVPQDRPTVSHPRNLILAERGAQAAIIETHIAAGDGVYFTNSVTELVIGEGAVIDYYKLQQESDSAFHVGTVASRQDRASNFTAHSIVLGGALVRNDLNSVLGAEGVECTLNGLYLASGRQHVDNHTAIDHAKPHCASREIYKGVLSGACTAVFNGKIFVRKDAQKTDAKQTNKNLLLSEDAVINTKPQLEINADDVRCTHGATIGQLDAEAIFYLRSRGIAQEEARRVLTLAFARDMIDRVKVDALRSRLEQAVSAHLAEYV